MTRAGLPEPELLAQIGQKSARDNGLFPHCSRPPGGSRVGHGPSEETEWKRSPAATLYLPVTTRRHNESGWPERPAWARRSLPPEETSGPPGRPESVGLCHTEADHLN